MVSLKQIPENVLALFPKKKLVGSTIPRVAEERRIQLQQYLRGVIEAIRKRPLSPLLTSPTKENLLIEIPFLNPDHEEVIKILF